MSTTIQCLGCGQEIVYAADSNPANDPFCIDHDCAEKWLRPTGIQMKPPTLLVSLVS
jgi:hypothetical protein